uniref:G_PROTEIN_RECEP_F1_2 domain-containing protein n=1 Tax=Meloidogyne hapla TaxID=6305 RepID=A0A1I8BJY0_MELHA
MEQFSSFSPQIINNPEMGVVYTDVEKNIITGCYIFISSFCAVILLIIIRPLYIFSKERTALFILLSKDRIQIMIICLISLLPCPLYIGMAKLDSINNSNNKFILISIGIIFNLSITLLSFIEEICLVIISKDFRKLVKKQFVKDTQTNIITVPAAAFVNTQMH